MVTGYKEYGDAKIPENSKLKDLVDLSKPNNVYDGEHNKWWDMTITHRNYEKTMKETYRTDLLWRNINLTTEQRNDGWVNNLVTVLKRKAFKVRM